jgi:ATP/maltotriose-dependent transcriptional regulator MalT
MSVTSAVDRAREAFARQEWGDAYTLLASGGSLEADDFERLAVAACWVGRDEESRRAWEQAYLELARLGEPDHAARCAVWLGIGLMLRGDMAQAGGWFARASRLVDEAEAECAARGYLLVPAFLESLVSGDAESALQLADEMFAIARQFDDKDLLALGTLSRGQASLALGDTTRAMSLLDEVMVAVAGGEVSPIPAGIIYCAVIEACVDVFDLRRAAEWTEALSHWCAGQPDLVPYRGQCLVHRSQVLQAHGEWTGAVVEAERARQRLSDTAHPALGLALYQQGELHRMRGELTEAERAYRAANEQGREPAPGIALLRLADGKIDAAIAAIRRMVDESSGKLSRPVMLAASVEIMLAAADVEAARTAADELVKISEAVGAPLLHAIAAHSIGSVLLAEGQAASALKWLRSACDGWRDLEMPYDAARSRVQIGLACRTLGDHDAAAFEMDAARATFERLGARTDLARLERLLGEEERPRPAELTDRECEVLRLVATGKTNREIAAALVISEHTVGRHLQNMFMKLGLASRAAATAYAYEHGLV